MKPQIVRLLEKEGVPFEIVHIPQNPIYDAEVEKYVLKIEEVHQQAAKSTLHFRGRVRPLFLSPSFRKCHRCHL